MPIDELEDIINSMYDRKCKHCPNFAICIYEKTTCDSYERDVQELLNERNLK